MILERGGPRSVVVLAHSRLHRRRTDHLIAGHMPDPFGPEAAAHRIQLAIRQWAMIFERGGPRSVVSLAHDVPQNPFWLSRSFQAAIAAAFAVGRSIFQAINGCPNIALTTRPPVTASNSLSASGR